MQIMFKWLLLGLGQAVQIQKRGLHYPKYSAVGVSDLTVKTSSHSKHCIWAQVPRLSAVWSTFNSAPRVSVCRMFHTHWMYQQALRCKDEACVVLTLQLLTNKARASPPVSSSCAPVPRRLYFLSFTGGKFTGKLILSVNCCFILMVL